MQPCLNILAVASLGLIACAGDGDNTIVILQNQAPGEDCTVPAAPTDSYIGAGRIDVVLAAGGLEGYLLTPVATNTYEVLEGGVDRTAFVEGIRVDLEFPADEALQAEFEGTNLVRFEIPYAAIISPAGGTTSFIAEIVPDDLLEELLDDVDEDESVLIIANVRLVGHIGDGGGFESANFRYPVEVCNGCLAQNIGSCAAIPTDYTIATGGACNLIQDVPLDCCTSVNGNVFCPAVRETPPAAL